MGTYLLVFTRHDGRHSTVPADFPSDEVAIDHARRVVDEHVVVASVVRGRGADVRLGQWQWRDGEAVWTPAPA